MQINFHQTAIAIKIKDQQEHVEIGDMSVTMSL